MKAVLSFVAVAIAALAGAAPNGGASHAFGQGHFGYGKITAFVMPTPSIHSVFGNSGGADADGDGHDDLFEVDNDADGLADLDEITVHKTSAVKRDTDSDGVADGLEVAYGLDPLVDIDNWVDRDGDGSTDFDELKKGMDPNRYVLSLRRGWNMVSIARKPQDARASIVFPPETVRAVWTQARSQRRLTRVKDEELEPLRGYWVYAVEDVEIELVAPQPASTPAAP